MSVQLNNVIISDVKNFLNIPSDGSEFDSEVIPFILGAIGELSQVGRINSVLVTIDTTWSELFSPNEEPTTVETVMTMVPVFVMMRVKLLFDPPPPSNVKFYDDRTEMLLWRLKTLYENTIELEPVDIIEEPVEPVEPVEPTEPIDNENILEGDVTDESTR